MHRDGRHYNPLRRLGVEPVYVEDRHELTAGVSEGFTVGLDLGKSQDFTAVVIAEIIRCDRIHWKRTQFQQEASEHSRRRVYRYRIVNLHRYPRGTSYPDIQRGVKNLLAQLPAREKEPALFVDKTGVGAPVVDAMREMGIVLTAISITAGSTVRHIDSFNTNVSKSILASTLDIALGEDRLEITAAATGSEILKVELQNFRVKKTAAGNDTMEAWRESMHDDLVLAAALAIWGAENRPEPARWSYINFMAR